MSANDNSRPSRSKALVYARVSSKEQEKGGFSIPAQLKLLRSYAQENGIEIVKEYVDAETAKHAGRTGFAEMVSSLEENPGSLIILVEKTDRLYRNLKDWVTLDELDVEVHFVKENLVLSRDSRSSEKFVHGIKVLMAKNYIDNLSEEVKKGMREKAEQGHWPSMAPIGYVNNLETHRIELDPTRAPVIAEVFRWYASGSYSLRQVTQMAANAGLTKLKSGKLLNKAEIHRILRNPIYYGDFVWNHKSYTGKHSSLISKNLFNTVQGVFDRANRPKQSKRSFAFTGLLTCGFCGCSMTAEIKKQRYVYYHCTGYRGKCGNTYVSEESLSEILGNLVKQIQIDPEISDKMVGALRDSHEDKKRFHNDAVKSLQTQYAAIQVRIDKAYDDKLEGTITEDFWQLKSGKWQAEQNRLRDSLAQYEAASDRYIDRGLEILELAKHAHSQYLSHNHQERRKILNAVLSNCTFRRGTLDPTYNKPFDILAAGVQTGDWRGRRDSNSRPPA